MTGTELASRSWLRYDPSGAEVDLVCLPHAGAGAASFTRWLGLFPPRISAVRVQLPGREDAAAEPPLRRVQDAVDALFPQVMRLPGAQLALYGHSMGALVAFELARALDAAGVPPVHLFVSGRRAPHLPARRAPVHRLPDDALVAELERTGAGMGPAGRSPAFLRYALPLVRADLELSEDYAHRAGTGLSCPITAFHGSEDPIVDLDQAEAWGEQTGAGFVIHTLPGDHFFHQRHRVAVAAHIATALG